MALGRAEERIARWDGVVGARGLVLFYSPSATASPDDQPHAGYLPPGDGTTRMRDGYLRGALSPQATQRQMDVLAAFVAAGGSVRGAAVLVGLRPSPLKRHLADLRAPDLTTEQVIYTGRAGDWLLVPSPEPR